MSKKVNNKGFTLIEVVLVLAIGGLIFLLAFLAFRQASTNRRDTQRRADAGRIAAEVANFASDKNGVIPTAPAAVNANACAGPASTTTFMGFALSYLCGNSASGFQDPEGANYSIVITTPTAKSQIQYTVNATCSATGTGANTFRIDVGLEKGTVCRDSGN